MYGYRAVILERNYYRSLVSDDATAACPVMHRVSASEQAVFTTLPCCPNYPDDNDEDEDYDQDDAGDFHRRYRPYQRLVAVQPDQPPAAVKQAALRLAGDNVQLIHRRLSFNSS